MERYVSGFLFSSDKSSVILVKKIKPDFLKDKWTAIGGKVEEGETKEEAMVREFKEETGVLVEDWQHFCTLYSDKFILDWFWSKNHEVCLELNDRIFDDVWNKDVCLNDAGEELECWSVDEVLFMENMLGNTKWIMQMALSMEEDRAKTFKVEELY